MIKDGVFGKQIIFEDEKQVKHNDFLGSGCLFICIVGSTGTGKTKLILNLIPNFSDTTKYIILCSLIVDNPIHDRIEKYCDLKKINYVKYTDVPTAEKSIEDIISDTGKEGHKLIIIDDFTEYKKSDDEYNIFATKCFSLLRNYNCSVIYITQSYSTIPTKARTNISIRIVGQCDNIYSIRGVQQDTSNLFLEQPFTLMDLYKNMLDDKHKFIFLRSNPPEIGMITNDYDNRGQLIKQNYEKLFPKTNVKHGGLIFTPETSGMNKKKKLFELAKQFGFPKDRWKLCTINELKNFIKEESAKGEKQAGNTAKEIDDILKNNNIAFGKNQLGYLINKWKRTQKPSYIDKIIYTARDLLDSGEMSKEYWVNKLENTGLNNFIQYNI